MILEARGRRDRENRALNGHWGIVLTACFLPLLFFLSRKREFFLLSSQSLFQISERSNVYIDFAFLVFDK